MTDMIYKTLGKTGLEVSMISFGAGPLGGLYGDMDLDLAKRAVHAAIDSGVNFIDTAPYYGPLISEQRLGEALKGGWREKVILATKCARYDRDLPHGFDFSAERLTKSVDESLARLQTDWIDVFQIHDIEFTHKQQIIEESLPALYKLREQGKIRFVGITGYPVHVLRDVAAQTEVDVILSYCHYNLLNTTMEPILKDFAWEHGIGLVNASTLHMGILTDPGPPPWHPAPARVKEAGRKAAQLAREHGSNITTLALQFAQQADFIATTLVGMRTPEEVEHNLALVNTAPDPELLAKVQALLAPVKDINWQSGLPENYEPDAVPTEEGN